MEVRPGEPVPRRRFFGLEPAKARERVKGVAKSLRPRQGEMKGLLEEVSKALTAIQGAGRVVQAAG